MLRRQCPSCTRHQFVPSLYRATSSHTPENFLLKAQTVFLPNDGALPTASIFTESSEEIFPAEWYLVTNLGPQVSFSLYQLLVLTHPLPDADDEIQEVDLVDPHQVAVQAAV
jgi:hypothetical protein